MRSGEKHPERAKRVEGIAADSRQRFRYVYILQCRSGKLYTGMTNNLLRRWREHQRGGARFTKGDPPVCMIHMEAFDAPAAALARERQLKGWTRRKKLALAAGDLALLKRL